MSNLGVATYNNTKILGIKSIEVVTSSNVPFNVKCVYG